MSEREQDVGGKEVFVSMLPSALEALCGMQGDPHDDTILHHLLDVIKELILTEDDAQRCGLVDLMDRVTENAHQLSSAVLVLALGAATHLASIAKRGTTGDLLWERVTSLYRGVQSSAAMGSCSSVGVAYFNSLTKLAAYPAGLQWLENSNVHFHAALGTLETAQSMFLLNAADTMVLAVLTNSLEAQGPHLKSCPPSSSMAAEGPGLKSCPPSSSMAAEGTDLKSCPPSSSMVAEGMQLLTRELTEMKRNRATLLDQMVVSSHVSPFHQSVTKIVCALTCSKTFCEWKVVDEALVSTLAHLALQQTADKIQSPALQSVVNLVAFMSPKTKEEFLMKQILSPLLKMMSEGGVERAVSVAAAFVKAKQDTDEDSEAMKSLQRLVQLPHDVLFGSQLTQDAGLTALVSAITAALCLRHRFARLMSAILHSVTQTQHGEGLVRLVHSAGLTRDDEDWTSVLASWPQGVGAMVVGNHKLLNALLDLLQQDSCLALTMQQSTQVLMSLMRAMRRPLVESRVYSKMCAAFVRVVGQQYKGQPPGETGGLQEALTHWAGLMEYRLVALQWEIRDTTLELVQSVVGIVSDPWFHAPVKEHHLLRLAWGCTKYGESYSRASAIALATSLVASPLWGTFLQDADLTEASLADEMMEVLAKDSEAFPRRAAVLLLTALVSRSSVPSATPSSLADSAVQRKKICAAMTAAINDFDWDVKLKVLDFWEKLVAPLFACEENAKRETTNAVNNKEMMSDSKLHRKRAAPEQNSGVSDGKYDMFEALLRDGFGKTVLSGTEDYDSSVKQKALRMLVSVQQQMEAEEESPVKARRESDTAGSGCVDLRGEGTSGGELPAASVVSVNQFRQAVWQLGPGRVLQQQSQSADEYDKKPASLLEDVMAAVKHSTTVHEVTFMSEDEFDDGDDMFVDCY